MFFVVNRLATCLALVVALACGGHGTADSGAAGPGGADSGTADSSAELAELNRVRARRGAEPVTVHPALEALAAWRAAAVAASGSADTDRSTLSEMTRRLRQNGYEPHNWTESVLIASGGEVDLMAKLEELRPAWFEKAATGDFEHAAVARVDRGGQTVFSVVLALPKRTVERRQTEPLADAEVVRERILAAVNAARAEHGLAPVVSNPLLVAAAQGHADDMLRRAYYSHTSPKGDSVMKRVHATGYRPRSVSENIAKGLFTPEEVVQRWLDSPGHRRNILRRSSTQTGSGVAFGENANGFEVLWVQVFAGP